MESIIAAVGDGTQWLLAPVAALVRPWVGEADWGLAIVLVAIGWQLPFGWWLIRSAKARILRAAIADRISVGGERTGAEARRAGQTRLREELVVRRLRNTSDVLLGRGVAAVSILVVVVVVIWSRTGPAAEGASFAGLRDLSESPVRSGLGGVAWALILAATIAVIQLTTVHVARVRDPRQRFFGTRILPVIFCGLGLFLPAATVIGFTASLVLSAVWTTIGALDTSLVDLATAVEDEVRTS